MWRPPWRPLASIQVAVSPGSDSYRATWNFLEWCYPQDVWKLITNGVPNHTPPSTPSTPRQRIKWRLMASKICGSIRRRAASHNLPDMHPCSSRKRWEKTRVTLGHKMGEHKISPGVIPNSPGTCPGTFPEPVVRNLPRNLPGTRGSEAAPAPPRNLYWQRPHS